MLQKNGVSACAQWSGGPDRAASLAQSGRRTAAPEGEDATRTQRRRCQRQRQKKKGLQAVHVLWSIESMLQRYTREMQSAKDTPADATADLKQGDAPLPLRVVKRQPEKE